MTKASNPRLEDAIANEAGRRSRAGTAAAFRAAVDQRLLNLESQLAEVKTRLNGLLFFIAGTVLAQVLLKLVS